MNPRNAGKMADADAVGKVGDPETGNVAHFYLKVENGVVVEVTFQTFGCGAAIAASSAATELAKGKTLREVLALTSADVERALDGVPDSKRHCPELAVKALHAAAENYLRASRELAP